MLPASHAVAFNLAAFAHTAGVTKDEIQSLIEEATADYAVGDTDAALAKLARVTATAADSFEGWHALAEVNFSLRRLDEALAAAERAHALCPSDLFINTTLSRIWMERGDKARAEHFGAQAKIESWREQLKGERKETA
jgi:predicted Zn-dependent protease